jgi:Xaa-Pro aminopeptidase
MSRRELDLVIVNEVANQHYITGYHGWSFYTPQVVLVPHVDEQPVWIGRAMDAAGGLLTTWMKPENVVGFPEDHVQRPDRHPMDWIAEWITKKGWGRGNTGSERPAQPWPFSPTASSPSGRSIAPHLLTANIRD